MVGLRADESIRRRRLVSNRVYENWISPYDDGRRNDDRVVQRGVTRNIFLCKPIYDWTTPDVWAAPRLLGWDYNTTYDVMAAAGIAAPHQRVCPPYGEEPMQRLWTYAVCWPELWEAMIYRVPGAATAARYSTSPAYAFNSVVKPDEQSWEEAIQEAIGRWPEKVAAKVALRIQKEITRHNAKTNSAPIPEDAEVGLTWRFLYTIAMRGDFKHRRTVKYVNYRSGGSGYKSV
jgi:predicted phosphoadenosine phosphosulfate sulfurtransferase